MTLRPARVADIPFLREMLYEAVYWRPASTRPPIDEALAHPDLAKLLAEWGRRGDAAVIAATSDGEPVGAAWYRFWTRDNHSYGYVADDIPELGIAVVRGMRRKGIGRHLVDALLTIAHENGIERVSLSVEAANPARALYELSGFAAVSEGDGAMTMVRETSRAPG